MASVSVTSVDNCATPVLISMHDSGGLMRGILKIGGGVLVLLMLVYAAGPLWAGWQLRQAMRTRDVALLEARVDWLLLRANLKPRIADAITDNADRSGAIGGAVKRALGSVLSNTAIDTLVTPNNLNRILAGRAFMLKPSANKPATDKPGPPDANDPAEDPDDPVPPKRVRWAFFESPTRFRVEAVNPKLPNSRIVTILALEGLSWKLVDIDIINK